MNCNNPTQIQRVDQTKNIRLSKVFVVVGFLISFHAYAETDISTPVATIAAETQLSTVTDKDVDTSAESTQAVAEVKQANDLVAETEQATSSISQGEATDQKPEQATDHIEQIGEPDAEAEQTIFVVPQGKTVEQTVQLESNTVPQENVVPANQAINTDTSTTSNKNTEPVVTIVRNNRTSKQLQHDPRKREIFSVSATNQKASQSSNAWNYVLTIGLLLLGGLLVGFFSMRAETMKLITKMVSLVGVLLALLVIIAVLGTQSMRHLGKELTNIANEAVPLSAAVAKITAHQLEQSVWVERGMLAAELDNTDGLESAIFEFERLTTIVQDNIEDNITLLENKLNEAGNKEAKGKYIYLHEKFVNIETRYGSFVTGANDLLGLMRNSEIAEAEQLLPEIEDEVEEMSELLQAFSAEINRSTGVVAMEAETSEQSARRLLMIVSLMAIALAMVIGWIIVRGIQRQLGADPSDLVGLTESLAAGELTMERNINTTGVYGSINQTIEKLIEVISGIKGCAEGVSVSSTQVSQGNTSLSQRTQEQAAALEEVASSMEEMTSTVNQNADNAQQANQLAKEARDQAESGGKIIKETVTAMDKINDSSKQISDITSVIDEIAFQTNLLALNAAVEAARAGEQGRGFAVVASEVRVLAGRSAAAAKEIKALIQDSVAKVEDGTQLVDKSGLALGEIVNSVKKVSTIVAEIAAASQEQSDGIQQVNKSILQMDQMTQQNASVVEEATAASQAMTDQAGELTTLVAYFKVDNSGGRTAGKISRRQQRSLDITQHVVHRPVTILPKLQERNGKVDGGWQEF